MLSQSLFQLYGVKTHVLEAYLGQQLICLIVSQYLIGSLCTLPLITKENETLDNVPSSSLL